MKDLAIKADSFKTKYEAFITGCDSIEELGEWNKELLGEMEAFYTNDIVSIIIRLIASDGKITEKETAFLNDAFDFTYTKEELAEVYNTCAENIEEAFDESFENGISYMRKINSKLADAYKELLYLICDIIIESDGIISVQEIQELEKLKEMCR